MRSLVKREHGQEPQRNVQRLILTSVRVLRGKKRSSVTVRALVLYQTTIGAVRKYGHSLRETMLFVFQRGLRSVLGETLAVALEIASGSDPTMVLRDDDSGLQHEDT